MIMRNISACCGLVRLEAMAHADAVFKCKRSLEWTCTLEMVTEDDCHVYHTTHRTAAVSILNPIGTESHNK